MIERASEMDAVLDIDTMNSTCNAWTEYVDKVSLKQDDSGI